MDKKLNICALVLVLLLLMIAGCGGASDKGESVEASEQTSAETPEQTSVAPAPILPEPTTLAEESAAEDKTIHVSSTEEFLEAIAPGVTIFVEPGYYNMSEYLEEVSTWKDYDWDAEHPYVTLEYCYDGVEVVIKNADNLTITGDAESLADTEIVVEPRYAAVLTFYNCCNLNLSFLTMGHTEIGDCSDGSLFITEALGEFEFHDCTFTGSYGGGYYENSADCELYFYNCIFGEEETNTWYFWQDIHAIDCTWSEVTEYPDYEYEPVFDIENMQEIDCNEYFLEDSWWIGYAIVNPESGEMTYLPYETEDEMSYYWMLLEMNDELIWLF